MSNESPKTSFVANEPVFAAAFVTWLFSVAGTYLLGHTHLITSDQWSSLSTFLVPVITALILTGLAYVTRRFVSPAWKAGVNQVEKLGASPELVKKVEDIAEAKVVQVIQAQIDKTPAAQPAEVAEPGPHHI